MSISNWSDTVSSLQVCLWIISQVSILAESYRSVLIFHQTVQCLHPIPISSISNWVNMKYITSFLEGKKRNSSQTSQIPCIKSKWGCPALHFGVRLGLGCWRGAILWGDEVLFTSRYEQPCGEMRAAAQLWAEWMCCHVSLCDMLQLQGVLCLCLPQIHAHMCTVTHKHHDTATTFCKES